MAKTPDSTEVDPDGHRIVFENDHVRVLEVRSPSGQKIPMHSHPPRVVVPVGSYCLKSISQTGDDSTVDRRPGEAVWVESEEHQAEILIGPTHVIEVEIKSAR